MVLKGKIADFIVRLSVAACAVVAYFLVDDLGAVIQSMPFSKGYPLVYPFWLLLIAWMIFQLQPGKWWGGMAANKPFPAFHRPTGQSTPEALQEERKKMNSGAVKVLLLWLAFFAGIAVLYFTGIFGKSEVVMVSMVLFVADAFFMVFWCPLQALFMKNKCCVNCRIYGWGQFLVCGTLFLVPGILTYSLAFFSLAILIRWEVVYFKHPERFWEGANKNLQCACCTEKSCTVKRTIENNLKPRTITRQESKPF